MCPREVRKIEDLDSKVTKSLGKTKWRNDKVMKDEEQGVKAWRTSQISFQKYQKIWKKKKSWRLVREIERKKHLQKTR